MTALRPARFRRVTGVSTQGRRRGPWPFWVVLVVAVVGLAATGALTWVSQRQYSDNEKRLLTSRGRELALFLTEAVPSVRVTLASAAALAAATDASASKFMSFAGPYAGPPPRHQFASISLWRPSALGSGPVAVVGAPPGLSPSSRLTQQLFARAMGTATFAVTVLHGAQPRLGYAVGARAPSGPVVVFAESLLPANRRSRLDSNTTFSDLDYALYLGQTVSSQNLLVTDVRRPPIRGRQAKNTVQFGDSALTLVVSPREPLGGTLPERLPWIVLAVGVLLTMGAVELTRRLIQGRRNAEGLAERLERAATENERLYAEQRTIAVTLQRALLPAELPRMAGAEASARFEPGEQRVEIGGDWYDVIPAEDDQVLLVVGDVTGRGLGAAATMAELRYAIRAYAAERDSPSAILTKLSRLLDVRTDRRLATVLCARVDIAQRTMTVASAGHLPPLLVSRSHADYIEGELGPPIGVGSNGNYASTTIAVPAAATLIAFTDGLIERRDETLDAGLDRLRTAVGGADLALPDLLDQLIGQLRPQPADDDTAIVGIRWNTETLT